jgi:DNA-binding beta-propeller fold protein YncE
MGLTIFLAISCDDDCPVCPGEDEIISDYDIIISSPYTQAPNLFVYNTLEKQIIDTIPMDHSWRSASLSADGSQLLMTKITQSAGDSLVIYGWQTMERITSRPVEGNIFVSNTGKYIAMLDDDSLVFLDGVTYDVLFSDVINTYQGCFLKDDSRFYTFANDNHIRIYDMMGESLYVDMAFTDPPYATPGIYRILPSPDGTRIFMVVSYGSIYSKYLISYYPQLDSVGLYYPVSPGSGEIAITPDERQLILTDHSNAFGDASLRQIVFIDLSTERVIKILSAGYCIAGQPTFAGFDPGHFCVTPDSRYALVVPSGFGPFHIFALVDIVNYKFEDIVYSPIEDRLYRDAFL